MTKLILKVVAMTVAFSGYAMAASPGGSDACGLGWEVTNKKTMSATTTRGTTNYFVPYTFGMTTGTMGCERHPLVKKEIDAAKYAVNNFESLNIEMAQGQGENLQAFAETMGCSNAAAVGAFTQKNYGKINGATNGLEMYENVRTLIRQDSQLKAACINII